tara:strand:- start:1894 stop:2388 length:495 start_codon:yes stop_codon:yes gene_type:complete
MVLTFNSLDKIAYPAYPLPNSNWSVYDGLVFLDTELLDDRNMVGATLGIRRAQTSYPSLFRLNKGVMSANGIIKQSTKCFIDSKGSLFIYEKTKMLTLKYIKIDRVVQKEVASLIYVKGHRRPFTVPRPPEPGMVWAGILHLHKLPWMLYEYSEEKLKDTKRKV